MIPIKFEWDYHLSDTDRKILSVPVTIYFAYKEIKKIFARLQKKRKIPPFLQIDTKRKVYPPIVIGTLSLLTGFLLTTERVPVISNIFLALLLLFCAVSFLYLLFLVAFALCYELLTTLSNLLKAIYIVAKRLITYLLGYLRIL